MDSLIARKLAHQFGAAVAYVAVRTRDGDASIGTAFHIGERVFLTARHVVENNLIEEIRIVKPVGVPSREFMPGLPDATYTRWDATVAQVLGRPPLYKQSLEPLAIAEGPFFPDDHRVDVAAFRVEAVHDAVPTVKLGMHWDDWVYRREWELEQAVLLGYPPIPMSNAPELVAARAEVHTFVVPRHCPFIHFILSATPRGGFSGGPAIMEGGYALGMITSGFVENNAPPELGFQAVISIEPIRAFLESVSILPACQDELLHRPQISTPDGP